MHKWFLPGVSILVGLLYVLLGLGRYFMLPGERIDFVPPAENGWAIAIGLGIAVLNFVFARFVAGMAKQPAWSLLHAGSAAAVGGALIGAAISFAHFFYAAVGNDVVLEYLPLIAAVFMMGIGAEIFLNFVLNMYRPRTPGEFQRPAFDSRVLAFVAAPDKLAESVSEAVNYQFGFNVSSTWFYRLLERSVWLLVVLAALILWGMTTMTIVDPQESALLIRNGQVVQSLDSGLSFKMPWPFDRVEKFPARSINQVVVGARSPSNDGPILWTNEHGAGSEQMFLVRPTVDAPEDRVEAVRDYALLVAEVSLHYSVGDLQKYLRIAQDAEYGDPDQMRKDLLGAAASGVVLRYFATLSVDEVLGGERTEMNGAIRGAIQAHYDEMDWGVAIQFAGVVGVHPKKEVAGSFEEVVNADQRRESEIERAEAERIARLASVAGSVENANNIIEVLDDLETLKSENASPEVVEAKEFEATSLILDSKGEASIVMSTARTNRWSRHMSARSQLVESAGQIAAYRAAPKPFMAREYLSALYDSVRLARVWIVPDQRIRVDMDFYEEQAAVYGFGPGTGEAEE
jgi:regulator of protease activity HflC (stomatin/prohibitin superfamily)